MWVFHFGFLRAGRHNSISKSKMSMRKKVLASWKHRLARRAVESKLNHAKGIKLATEKSAVYGDFGRKEADGVKLAWEDEMRAGNMLTAEFYQKASSIDYDRSSELLKNCYIVILVYMLIYICVCNEENLSY